MKFLPDLDPNSKGYYYSEIERKIQEDEELTLEEVLFVLKAANWGATLLFDAIDCLTTDRQMTPDGKAMLNAAIEQEMNLCYMAAMEEIRDTL